LTVSTFQLTKRVSAIHISHEPLGRLARLARLSELDDSLAFALLADVQHLGERDVADGFEELDKVFVRRCPGQLDVSRST
jgi:hypothetical protein